MLSTSIVEVHGPHSYVVFRANDHPDLPYAVRYSLWGQNGETVNPRPRRPNARPWVTSSL